MAIDNETYQEISERLLGTIDGLWNDRKAEDIGPVIAAAFCRMGVMFFYCSENKSAAAVATLEAATAGIEEAMQHEAKDMLEAASSTLQ